MEALPVELPALLGLVDAAGERHPIAGLVLDDAGLLVEQREARDRLAVRRTRHGHLHVEEALRDHPCEELQRLHFGGAGRDERHLQQVHRRDRAQGFAAGDRFRLRLVERAADQ
jgi:hypothetical protein